MALNDEYGNSNTTLLRVYIRIEQDGNLQETPVDLSPDSTVSQLKERYSSTTGIEASLQRLIYKGQVLQDEQHLSSYGIQQNHVIILVVRNSPAEGSRENGQPVCSHIYQANNLLFLDQPQPLAQLEQPVYVVAGPGGPFSPTGHFPLPPNARSPTDMPGFTPFLTRVFTTISAQTRPAQMEENVNSTGDASTILQTSQSSRILQQGWMFFFAVRDVLQNIHTRSDTNGRQEVPAMRRAASMLGNVLHHNAIPPRGQQEQIIVPNTITSGDMRIYLRMMERLRIVTETGLGQVIRSESQHPQYGAILRAYALVIDLFQQATDSASSPLIALLAGGQINSASLNAHAIPSIPYLARPGQVSMLHVTVEPRRSEHSGGSATQSMSSWLQESEDPNFSNIAARRSRSAEPQSSFGSSTAELASQLGDPHISNENIPSHRNVVHHLPFPFSTRPNTNTPNETDRGNSPSRGRAVQTNAQSYRLLRLRSSSHSRTSARSPFSRQAGTIASSSPPTTNPNEQGQNNHSARQVNIGFDIPPNIFFAPNRDELLPQYLNEQVRTMLPTLPPINNPDEAGGHVEVASSTNAESGTVVQDSPMPTFEQEIQTVHSDAQDIEMRSSSDPSTDLAVSFNEETESRNFPLSFAQDLGNRLSSRLRERLLNLIDSDYNTAVLLDSYWQPLQ